MRVEPCKCGGRITVGAPQFPGDVAFSVRRHTASDQHQAWRVSVGVTPENPAHDLLTVALRRSREMQPDLLIPLRDYPRRSVLSRIAS